MYSNNRYNFTMSVRFKFRYWSILLILLIFNFFSPISGSQAASNHKPMKSTNVTAYDLIIAMNTLRISYGLPALIEDPIINAVAQSTAEIMAANQMSWHIGDVRGRLAAAGYGGGATVWGTENFAVGTNKTIDEIMLVWADDSHMIPAVNPAYCHVGAGIATAANGQTYYVLQAAYTSNKSCGEYTSVGGTTNQPGGSTDQGRAGGISQLIVPVKIATPDEEGRLYHLVQAGQSFWSIAIAYKITIKDIEVWNNLSRDTNLLVGQRLFIPTSNTEGYATPTPVGMVITSKPDKDGKIVHVVQPYQTLITISQAYNVSVDRILILNGIQKDWPLQIEQRLMIDPGFVTPSPTPRPLTPIEKLTPESDGQYYHVVSSGETLSWIANHYEITLADLMTWNSLSNASIIRPNQKLVLLVTPPATDTPIPPPATATDIFTQISSTPTPSPTVTLSMGEITVTPDISLDQGRFPFIGLVTIGLTVVGLLLFGFFVIRKR